MFDFIGEAEGIEELDRPVRVVCYLSYLVVQTLAFGSGGLAYRTFGQFHEGPLAR